MKSLLAVVFVVALTQSHYAQVAEKPDVALEKDWQEYSKRANEGWGAFDCPASASFFKDLNSAAVLSEPSPKNEAIPYIGWQKA